MADLPYRPNRYLNELDNFSVLPPGGTRSVTSFRLRQSDLEWVSVDGQVIALDLQDSRYLATNPSGAVIWEALVGGGTHEDLVAALVDSFAITPDQATHDVDAFLAVLDERGLLLRN